MKIQTTYWGHIKWLHSGESDTADPTFNIGIVVINPGCCQRRHIHYGEEQFIYILSGTCEQTLDGVPYRMEPGDSIYITSGVLHEMVNTGSEPLTELLVSRPVSFRHDLSTHFPEIVETSAEYLPSIYPATESIRVQLQATYKAPYAIFDADRQRVLQGDWYPPFCLRQCRPQADPPRCACMISRGEDGDAAPGHFVCPHGLVVYHMPVLWRGRLLGWIRGGHIVRSDISGNLGHAHLYDTPQSSALGIQNMLRQIARSIVAYCEFDVARHEMNQKKDAIAQARETHDTLKRDLRDSESKVSNLLINRHFLFNTLNSMASMALQKEGPALYEAILNLSKMLRYTSLRERTFVALKDELDYIETYLQLQRLRYKNRLSIERNIDPQVFPSLVPKNFLQPIIENSFVHGFKNTTHRMRIVIEAEAICDDVRIAVHNNGNKPKESDIENINASLASDNGHGLSLIHGKLRSVYGDNFSMRLAVSDDRVSMEIRLPAVCGVQCRD